MLIEFSFNRKLLFLLIFPIFKISGKPIRKIYINNDNYLFRIFRLFLSNELSFIFLLIIKCINKSKKKEISSNEHEHEKIEEKSEEKADEENNVFKIIDNEINKSKRKNKFKSIMFLLLLSILNLCSYFFNYYVGKENVRFSRNTIGIIYEIIILYILSSIILKEKYYKHHYLSIIIICLSLIGLFILYCKELDNEKYSIYNAFWYYIVYYILYGNFNVFLKKYFIVYFFSIYHVLLIIGGFVCVPMLIYDIITFYVNKDISGIIIGFIDNINDIQSIFLFIIDLIFTFISNLGIFWTIYYFTPFHLIICEFISELLNYYIDMIDYPSNYITEFIYEPNNIIIFSIIFVINLICSLIFNEIIILKFCKLEYYTKKYIKIRATMDVSAIFLDEDSKEHENESLINNAD